MTDESTNLKAEIAVRVRHMRGEATARVPGKPRGDRDDHADKHGRRGDRQAAHPAHLAPVVMAVVRVL